MWKRAGNSWNEENVRVAIEAVPFEFQRGADRVFRAWRTADSRQSRRDWAT